MLPLELHVGVFYIFLIRQKILKVRQEFQGTDWGMLQDSRVFGCACSGTQNYLIPCQRFGWNQQVPVKCFDSVKLELIRMALIGKFLADQQSQLHCSDVSCRIYTV